MAQNFNFIKFPFDIPAKIVKWKVKPRARIVVGTVIALYQPGDVKQPLKLKSTSVGVVKELLIQEGAVVQPHDNILSYEACRHQTVIKDLCAECGKDLKKETQPAWKENSTKTAKKSTTEANVAMVHSIPELVISEQLAKELGQADEDRLLKNKQLALLVDLDQTLIHTTNDRIPANLKDVEHFQLHVGPSYPWYHTKIRPGTKKFLQKMSAMYELHICTFGARLYAHQIAAFLDPDGKFFSHRILSRDECFEANSKTANLKALFPCGDSMVCIIDDREDVWNFSANIVPVKPYLFFGGTADINAPPGLGKSKITEDEKAPKHKVIVHKIPRKTSTIAVDEKQIENEDGTNKPPHIAESTQKSKLNNENNSENIIDSADKANIDDHPQNTCNDDMNKQDKHDNVEHKESKSTVTEATKTTEEASEQDSDIRDDFSKTEKTHSTSVSESESGSLEANAHGSSCDDAIRVKKDENDTMEMTICGDSPVARITKEETGSIADDNTSKEYQSAKLNENVEQDDSNEDQQEKIEKEGEKNSQEKKLIDENNSNDQKEDDGEGHSRDQEGKAEATVSKDKADEEYDELIEWEDTDDYLLYLEDILTRIHRAYYQFYKQKKESVEPNTTIELPTVKNVIPYVKCKTLQGVNILFSGVIPTKVDIAKSRAYATAVSLGAKVHDEFIPETKNKTERTTHVVAARPGTVKVQQAKKHDHVKIVSSHWLWACNDRWEHVDERLYPLSEDTVPLRDKNFGRPKQRKRKKPSDKAATNDVMAAPKISKEPKLDGETEVSKRVICEDTSDDSDSEMDDKLADAIIGRRFSETYNPMATFSQEDLSSMDKEVDEIFGESDESDSSSVRSEKELRKRVLGLQREESSDDESLSGDFPLGWRKKKVKESPTWSEDHEGGKIVDWGEHHPEEAREEILDVSETSESNTSDLDSIGSVDEEMAAALEKELLS